LESTLRDADRSRQRLAIGLIGALALLLILWETALAPVRPGGSWLVLKALPLALVWPGIARGRVRSRQIASLLLPFYFAEAIVRAVTEPGRYAMVAGLAALLCIAAFVALLRTFRNRR
jgi:uncharacterized membrane protein